MATTNQPPSSRRTLRALAIVLGLWSLGPGQRVFSADPAPVDAPPEVPITQADREHWAYRSLTRPEPPAVAAGWVRNDIDRFVLARLEKLGLQPMPEADRTTLIRRVTLDLTGLPPTPAEVAAFLADPSPDAYDKLIDRLLASPAHGERYAQHWLDLARFAETDGFEHDLVRPHAWKYRDWVIDALNRDLPYDEFIRLQLAGDLLVPGDEAAAIATGFVLCGPDMPDLNLQDERRHNVMNDLTATVGSALLGLQMGCAQCHNHKYDPISQADFYRLRAIFESGVTLKDQKFGRVLFESGDPSPVSRLMIRGDFRRPGPELTPAFPRIANPWEEQPVVAASARSELRPAEAGAPNNPRVALARWLTRPDHPLATRVIANRLWQYHFGRGLAGTPSDFGVMGEGPTHPELLDWLATELPRRAWSLKAMHRLMLASATYRQASRPGGIGWSEAQTTVARENWSKCKEVDPNNRLLWRANRQRLDGEAIRDAMLASADRLSSRRGGPGVRPPLPDELVSTLLKKQWEVSPDEEDHRRRSIYLFVRRNLRYPIFEVFDRPDTNASCPQRNRSTTAPQALLQFNSEFSLHTARELAAALMRESNEAREQVRSAYRRCLAREPDAMELQEALEFLGREEGDERLARFCLAMFNLNEFIYVD